GQGDRRGGHSPRFEIGEGTSVAHRISTHADCRIVATVLTLDSDAGRNPPHRWMIEKQGLRERLEQVHGVVMTTDVRELVSENRLHLGRRKIRNRRQRKDNGRPQPPDHGGYVDEPRFDDTKRPGHPHPIGYAHCRRLPAAQRREEWARWTRRTCHQPPVIRPSSMATPNIQAMTTEVMSRSVRKIAGRGS